MTDKQIINTLRNIQDYCKKHGSLCDGCIFDKENCLIQDIAWRLYDAPVDWDMEEIERIINE